MTVALVLGGASCVWRDYAVAAQLTEGMGRIVVAVNDAGCDVRQLDHWATLHPEKLPWWEDLRREHGLPGGYETWGCEKWRPCKAPELVDHVLEGRRGSSGLFGVRVALKVGAARVICCGIPMDPSPHYFSDEPWTWHDHHWPEWERRFPEFSGRVKSMGGRTRELLGAPTREWLRGGVEGVILGA